MTKRGKKGEELRDRMQMGRCRTKVSGVLNDEEIGCSMPIPEKGFLVCFYCGGCELMAASPSSPAGEPRRCIQGTDYNAFERAG
jgi:hypothetical protein